MSTSRIISLHPRLAAALEGLVALFFVWWLGGIASLTGLLIWFGIRVAWWMILIYGMYFPDFVHRLEHFEAVVLFNAGVVLLLIFIDNSQIRYLFEMVLVLGSFFSFWLAPTRTDNLALMAKPYRRFKFLLSIFGVAGSWTAVKALDIFQVLSAATLPWLGVVAVGVTALVSVWGWREYSLVFSRKLLVAIGVLMVIVTQMAYVIFLWPLGYFTSGFLITWLWYVLWLLFRFALTDEGVSWRKQRSFILTNGALLAIFLTLLTRWK